MANTNEFKVEGKIEKISFPRTSTGSTYARIRVKGSLANMDVVVFDKTKVRALRSARLGDSIKAIGTGYHQGGSFHDRGNTSLTARIVRIKADETARLLATTPAPEQLSLI